MKDFADDRVELANPHITSARRVKARTMERLGLAPEKARRPVWPRTLVIAAAAVCLLAASALAAYHFGLQDRVLITDHGDYVLGETIVQYSAVAGPADEGSREAEAPLSHTPEYMAEAELLEYRETHTEAFDATRLLPQDHFARLYGLGYDFFAEKLEELADTYDLRLRQAVAYCQSLTDFYALLGTEPFLNAAADEGNASVYDEGSFEVNLRLLLPDGSDYNLNFYRAAKGSFTNFLILGGAPETYTYESYVTEEGIRLDLAWSEDDALIFAELENCYITAELGYGPILASHLLPEGEGEGVEVTMEDLKAVAESINFSALEALDTAAIGQRVTQEYELLWAEYRASETAPSEKAEAVLEELGSYTLSAVPAELVRHHSDIRSWEDNEDNLWVHMHPGCNFAEVSHFWEPDAEVITNYVSFRYVRCWADEERSDSYTRENFDEEKAERAAGNYAEMADLTVNGCEGYYYRDTGLRSTNTLGLVWLDEGADLEFSLLLPGDWALEDAVELAESMTCLD